MKCPVLDDKQVIQRQGVEKPRSLLYNMDKPRGGRSTVDIETGQPEVKGREVATHADYCKRNSEAGLRPRGKYPWRIDSCLVV